MTPIEKLAKAVEEYRLESEAKVRDYNMIRIRRDEMFRALDEYKQALHSLREHIKKMIGPLGTIEEESK